MPAETLQSRHLLHAGGETPDPKVPSNPPVKPAALVSETEMEYNKPTLASAQSEAASAPSAPQHVTIGNGDVLIAAITSCTNTSNPGVLLAAGLLAKKAVQAGMRVQPHIKTSLAPGSRIVTEYLTKAGLLPYLEQLGFTVAGYGCTTCIGNSGDLAPEINEAIAKSDLVCAAVLSGNRNFEARIHPNIKANFLASPPLVVAYALAGTVLRDLMTEPVGKGHGGKDVWLGDIWPTSDEIHKLMKFAMDGKAYRENYAKVKSDPGELWKGIKGVAGETYAWPHSTYIAEPPLFSKFDPQPPANDARQDFSVRQARIMALFGDSITTDHISPAGSIKETSPAGQWLLANGVQKPDFNSYGARRGNHDVMMRGTFANVRIKNLMIPAQPDGSREEGGLTLYRDAQGNTQKMFIFDAAMKYMAEGRPTVIFAGEEYGTGSSRDWAAKGTQLLGIKAVVARSFERIHRSNLVGMGVLPLQFKGNDTWQSLQLDGSEFVDVIPDPQLRPQSDAQVVIIRKDGSRARSRSRCASTPPSRCSTTATAASFLSCCGSCSPRDARAAGRGRRHRRPRGGARGAARRLGGAARSSRRRRSARSARASSSGPTPRGAARVGPAGPSPCCVPFGPSRLRVRDARRWPRAGRRCGWVSGAGAEVRRALPHRAPGRPAGGAARARRGCRRAAACGHAAGRADVEGATVQATTARRQVLRPKRWRWPTACGAPCATSCWARGRALDRPRGVPRAGRCLRCCRARATRSRLAGAAHARRELSGAGGEAVNVVAFTEGRRLERPGLGPGRRMQAACSRARGALPALRDAGCRAGVAAVAGARPRTAGRCDGMASGRAALLGDAAHPMRPYLAQGAGMALEDAAELQRVLAACDGRVIDVPTALQRYALDRWERCARVQRRAMRNGVIFHATRAVAPGAQRRHARRGENAARPAVAVRRALSQRSVRRRQISGNSTTSSILRR
jgi:hypothetical protein